MMKTRKDISFPILLLAATAIATGCTGKSDRATLIRNAQQKSIVSNSITIRDDDKPIVLIDGGGTASVQNFAQILASYSAVTGVPPSDGTVSQVYGDVLTRLSVNGKVDEVSSASLLGIQALAGAYCKSFISLDTGKTDGTRLAFNGVKIGNNAVASELGLADPTNAKMKSISDGLARVFWRRPSATPEEVQILTDAVKSSGITGNTAQALLVACTAAASSLDSIAN